MFEETVIPRYADRQTVQ